MSIDYQKLLAKLMPEPGGEDVARMRVGIVDAVNADGTVNLGIAGIIVPSIPVLSSAGVSDNAVVNVISYRGSLLVIGSTATAGGQGGSLGRKVSSAANTTSTANNTLIKDSGCGDLAFTAVAGRRYRLSYRARFASSVAADAADVRILDNGASSPVAGSTARAGSSYYMPSGTSNGSVNIVVDAWVDCTADIAAGVHTVAAFFTRTVGTGTVTLSQATGQVRTLTVKDEGPIYP
jgi:hypothetical protein